MTLPLSANLPLRTSSVWGAFGAVATIPHRYGRSRGAALRYDDSGMRYVWADHASELVSAVWIDGQATAAWTWSNTQDVTGRAVTMIQLSQPTVGDVTAQGYGKINGTSGALLDDPAEIITDLLALADRDAPDVAWLGYEASKLGITCSGTLDDDISVEAAISAVCESIGALWSPRGRHFARIYPGGLYEGGAEAAEESGATFDVADLRNASSDIGEIVNAVVVEFDFADGEAQQTIELDCPDSVARFGRREKRIEARWICDARVANGMATRLLTYYAEPGWQYAAQGLKRDVRTFEVAHWTGSTSLPRPDSAIVLGSVYDPNEETCTIEFERLTPTGAQLRLVRQGSRIEDSQLALVSVTTQGDNRRIQIKDEAGAPAPIARVEVAGLIRYTDAGGWVVLPVSATPPGVVYTLKITYASGAIASLSLLIQ